jgi:hypothetical protein
MPDPISLITAPARLGLRLATLPLHALRRLTGTQEPSFDDNDASGPESVAPAAVAEPASGPNGASATVKPPAPRPPPNTLLPR